MDKILYRPHEVAAALGISRAGLARIRARDPNFPRPVQLGPRAVAYVRTEIEDYVLAQPRATAAGSRPAKAIDARMAKHREAA